MVFERITSRLNFSNIYSTPLGTGTALCVLLLDYRARPSLEAMLEAQPRSFWLLRPFVRSDQCVQCQ